MGSGSMRAAVFNGELHVETCYPIPEPPDGWALIRVHSAGICGTDMEILKGYKGFKGVLGHEFVGSVVQSAAPEWIGQRVVGEINAPCGVCHWCRKGLGRHCPERRTLGIQGLDGCMADYCILPLANLLKVPETLTDDRAVFVEPVAAACEIMEQVSLRGNERCLVLGDGRLGIICAWALCTVLTDVTLAGHHPEKLEKARWRHLKTALHASKAPAGADLVVEATGSGSGMADAMTMCRPRGTILLKSTVASQGDLDLTPVVINELNVVGSRCGRFKDGLHMLESFVDMPVERLISARYPMEEAAKAFERAGRPNALKVLLEVEGTKQAEF
jgi:threonine dehydrogenase-like Zn-dependent dehydrogenase